MLRPEEKAYTQALVLLRQKNYAAAADQFDRAAPAFARNREFGLLRETTQLLLAVKEELSILREEELQIEEVFSNGQETELRG
jgi:hypothetical protein